MSLHKVTIWVDIDDPSELYAAAVARYMQDCPRRANTSEHEYMKGLESTLGDASDGEDSMDLDACLVMLLDPGTLPGADIDESTSEAASDV